MSELEQMVDSIRVEAAESLRIKREFFEQSAEDVARAAGVIIESMRAGGKLLVCGNGGSAADSQHMAAELAFKMGRERRALPAIALTTDSSLLTAISNDHSFDNVFARQIQALGRSGDVVLLISTSGNSENTVAAAREARQMGITTIGLLGADGGRMAGLVDYALIVRHHATPRVQEVHLLIEHLICHLIEDELCPLPQSD
jgi:D-sedoheptulose 7-phosphate isomerase